MKLKQLTINNIASIEQAEIRFDAHPLKDESLFLICGSTGAGKSTVLDAICLALFGTTPRMSVAGNDAFQPVGASESVTLQNPAQLLRHGASQASVSLTFVGNDGELYESIWSVRVKRSGNLDSAKWSLRSLSLNGKYWEKKGEVEDEIQRVVGAKFSDFTKTTMLAQGDFAQFLKSKAIDKANILQGLFGDDIYERIGKKIFEVHKEKEQEKRDLQKEMESHKLLTSEEIEQRNYLLNTTRRQVAEKTKLKAEIDAKAEWKKRKADMSQSFQMNEEKRKTLLAGIEGELYRNQSLVIKQWGESSQAIAWMNQRKDKSNALVLAKEKEASFLSRFQLMCRGIKGEQCSLEENNRRLKEISEAMANCSDAERRMFDQSETIVEKLDQAQRTRKKAQDCRAKLKETESLLTNSLAEVESSEKKFTEMKAQEEALQQRVDEAGRELLSMDPNGDLLARHTSISDLSNRLSTLKDKLALWLSLQKEEESIRQELAKEEQKELALETAKKQADVDFEKADLAYKAAARAVNDMAKELRRSLRQGEPCPVCGQVVHSVLSDEHFLSVLAEPEEARKRCEAEQRRIASLLEASKQLIVKYKRECEVKSQTVKSAQLDFEGLKSSVVASYAELKMVCEEKNFSSLADLSDEMEKMGATAVALKERVLELNRIQAKRAEAQKAKDEQHLITEEQKKVCDVVKKKRDDLQNEIKNNKELCTREEEEERSVLVQLEGMMAIADWRKRYEADAPSLVVQVQELSKKYEDWKENQKMLATKIEVSQRDLEFLESTMRAIVEKTSWTVPTVEPQPMANLPKASALLQSGISEWKQEMVGLERNISEMSQHLDAFFAEHVDLDEERLSFLSANYTPESISKLVAEHEKTENEYATICGECNSLKNGILEMDSHSPLFSEQEKDWQEVDFRNQSALLQEELSSCNQMIGSITRELESDEETRKHVGKLSLKMEEVSKEEERWFRLNEKLGDSTGSKFKRLALRLVFDNLLQNANRYLRSFDDNFELAKQEGFVIEVKDYRSNRNLSSSSLSGGQQFMVSLALALGLADMAESSRFASDTIFIDEGFGTLSEDYLANVMDCLEKLHQTTGKRVGIISHVERLRERIATQIVVEGGNTSVPSRVKVVCME